MIYKELQLRSENQNVKLIAYILDEEITHHGHINRPAILVCPGGGYSTLAHKESEPIAARFLGLGFNVFLLDYSTNYLKRPDEQRKQPVYNKGFTLDKALEDICSAIDIIGKHAKEWFIDEDRIYALGFSAGAHLVGMLAENYDGDTKLRGILMGYPLITPNTFSALDSLLKETKDQSKWNSLIDNIHSSLPRTFIWQTDEDSIVTPAITTQFVMELQKAGIPVEYHLYQTGGHGMALADRTSAARPYDLNYPASRWIEAAKIWLDLDEPELKLIPDNRE